MRSRRINHKSTVIFPPGPARRAARRWVDVIHRWLGFTAGAILVVAGLTGTLLAFYVEIERGLYPHMQTAVECAIGEMQLGIREFAAASARLCETGDGGREIGRMIS